MPKIPRENLFVQVPYEDLLSKLLFITLFKINPEIYIKPKRIDACLERDLNKVRAVLDRHEIRRTLHAPICDPYKEGFKIFKESYYASSRICRRLEINTIVMHVEYESKKAPHLEEWLKDVIGIWREISDLAKKDGVSVLLENHNETSAEPIIRILKETKSENLKACFDLGHFNAFGRKDIISYIDDYPGDSIKEFHLSDNLRDGDTHLALGKGNIDFIKFFEAVEKRPIEAVYTIEASDIWGVIGGIRYLKRIGKL